MSVSESPLDGTRSPLRDRETSRRISLRPPGCSGIISIHQRSKVRHKDFLVFDVMLLRHVMNSESSDFFARSCARRKTMRMGQHTWLLLATIGTELLAIIKWSKGQFPTPLPTHVWFAWLVGAAMLILYPVGQVSGHATTFLGPGRFFRASNMCSCSPCSSAYPALADICGGLLANQESRLSNLTRLPCGLLNILYTLYDVHSSHVYILQLYKYFTVLRRLTI